MRHVLVIKNSKVAHWISSLKISWRSSLTSSFFFYSKGITYFEIHDLWFEQGMILFLYGGMIRERALEVLQTGMFYILLVFVLILIQNIFSKVLQFIYFSLFIVDMVQSATLFRKAAGVYQYLVGVVLPCLQTKQGVERPPECMIKVASAMSIICLAEAQVGVYQ